MTAGRSELFRCSFTDNVIQNAAFDYAKEKAEEVFSRSKMNDSTSSYPKFTIDEIKLGNALGKGNFGIVYECKEFATSSRPGYTKQMSTMSVTSSTSLGEEEQEENVKPQKFLLDYSFRHGGGRERYALKMLRQEVIRDPASLIRASIDMDQESRILSSINHPNIIKMHACGAKSPYKAGYFIVLDRLYDTLDKRIKKWAKKESYIKPIVGRCFLDPRRKKLDRITEDKLITALDLAGALEYLHSQNIVFRDLKPDNVGFDIRDDVKLFDFGLAKEVHMEDGDANGLFRLTTMTGSPLYMAPEVAMGKPYGFSCDVYSFAILFWHMYTGKEPFLLYFMKDMINRVWSGEHKRPKIKESWPLSMIGFLYAAWSHDIKQRPTFQQVYQIFEQECSHLDHGDTSLDLHSR